MEDDLLAKMLLKSHLTKMSISVSTHTQSSLELLRMNAKMESGRNEDYEAFKYIYFAFLNIRHRREAVRKGEIISIDPRCHRLFANENEMRRHWRINNNESKEISPTDRPSCTKSQIRIFLMMY